MLKKQHVLKSSVMTDYQSENVRIENISTLYRYILSTLEQKH